MDHNLIQNWLAKDPRRIKPPSYSFYPLTVDLVIKKTKCLLPATLIQNKSVLDLGSGIPYVEPWCNENNARYTGVEIQKNLAQTGKTLISAENNLFHDSIENFIDNVNLTSFDVIVVSSSLQCVQDFEKYLNILIDSGKTLIFEFTNKFSNQEEKSLNLSGSAAQHTDTINESVFVAKSYPSYGFIKYRLESKGYTILDRYYQIARKILPNWYDNTKFLIHASASDRKVFFPSMQNKTWSFSKEVAEIFEEHAKKHIPDYSFVIRSLPAIMKQHCIEPNDHILDFGCATGTSLRILRYFGFCHLTGIDNSKDMLDRCPAGLANLALSDTIPDKTFKAIIANWTLHFNSNKKVLIEKIYENLSDGGLCVLSEKTRQTPRNLYHAWKINQGCTEQEVLQKEQSLRGKMFCEDVDWYEKQFENIGFQTEVYNSKLGFYTWILRKK